MHTELTTTNEPTSTPQATPALTTRAIVHISISVVCFLMGAIPALCELIKSCCERRQHPSSRWGIIQKLTYQSRTSEVKAVIKKLFKPSYIIDPDAANLIITLFLFGFDGSIPFLQSFDFSVYLSIIPFLLNGLSLFIMSKNNKERSYKTYYESLIPVQSQPPSINNFVDASKELLTLVDKQKELALDPQISFSLRLISEVFSGFPGQTKGSNELEIILKLINSNPTKLFDYGCFTKFGFTDREFDKKNPTKANGPSCTLVDNAYNEYMNNLRSDI